jgi:uncharacterized membrane protein
MYSKVKLFGHPIHPMLVAFPVAAYTGTLATFVVYDVNGHPFWLNAAIALNVAGVCAAVLAALPGLVDWLFGIPRRSGAKTVGLFHAFFNVAALGLFLASIDRYADSWNAGAADPTFGLVLSSAGVAATLMAGGLGWRLVQTYHVGILLTPAQEQDESAVQSMRPIEPRRSA